jgi:ribosomal protein S15P/S13E
MDQTKFVNAYIQKLSDTAKNLMLEKIVFETQITLMTEEISELKKHIAALEEKLTPQN